MIYNRKKSFSRSLVECYGLPLHAWSTENMQRIGSLWGDVVEVQERMEEAYDLSSVKLLIVTNLC